MMRPLKERVFRFFELSLFVWEKANILELPNNKKVKQWIVLIYKGIGCKYRLLTNASS